MAVHAEASDRIAAISRARSATSSEEIIAGVKEIVAREITQLSPDARLVSTSYFNHTYMPDFVLEWREAGKSTSRPVFIRNHLSDSVAEHEVDALADQEPVVLGLDTIEGEDAPPIRQAADSSRLLFSDVASIDALARASDAVDGPIIGLVRSNVLRGGKGLLGGEEVETVAAAADLDPAADDAGPRLERFTAMAATMFEEAAATRLLRAADIVRLSLLAADAPFLAAVEGRLDDSDLRILLPYLLDRDSQIGNAEFWRYIGSMMDLQRLEEFASVLEGLPLDPLVVPNLEQWSGRRAQLSLNSAFDEEDAEIASASWAIPNGVLTATVGPYLLAVASSGRKLKTRDNSRLPAWDAIRESALRYRLHEVNLRGIVRRVRVSAEQSGNVAEDVAQIASTLEDSYSVDEITISPVGADSDDGMTVDFSTWLVTAASSETVRDLCAATIDFLPHAKPVSTERRAALLGSPAAGS